MQIIELYIKGYTRFQGSNSNVTANKLVDGSASFTQTTKVGDYVENLNDGSTAKITAIDSDTQLSISADIFTATNQLYEITSDYFRADMFKDESVVITDSILNVRDISKVFTPFSKEFNLPASKLNNKLFRHYENTDIIDSFDARYRHDAIIKLNGIDYKKGKIQFRNVKLKNNKAYSYKVTFFGETVDLKTILADSTLNGLDYGDLDFTYNQNNISDMLYQTDSQLEATFGHSDLKVANIHHSKNMRFSDDGYRDYITGNKLNFSDFKPAIRLSAIAQAITRTFPQIQFGAEFLYSQNMRQIYMWLHRNEGFTTNAEEGGDIQIITNRWKAGVDDYTFTSNTVPSVGDIRGISTSGTNWINTQWKFNVLITPATNEPYNIKIIRSTDGEVIPGTDIQNVTGPTNTWGYLNNQTMPGEIDITVEVTSNNTLSMTQSVYVAKETRPNIWNSWTEQYRANYSVANSDTQNTFFIAKHTPNMKVIDFLSGLFKMFNFVVYKKAGIITIKTPSEYQYNSKEYDITKYVDMESATMDRLFQYKKMDFKFKSKKSFLVQFADEINGIPFAEESYGNDRWDGGVYKVEVPFEKMMYERLTNEDTGALSTIGQGSMLNKKFEPTIGEPLIFIPILQHNPDNDWDTNFLSSDYYYRPSNMTNFDWGFSKRLQLNFGEEIDEYLLQVPPSTNTVNLFSYQYQNYVEGVFRRNARMLKVTAYLPISILTQYELNSKFIINNKIYRINSIKTNLLTNKSDLELYNVDEFANEIENGQVAWAGRIADLSSPSVGSDFINIVFTKLTDPNVSSYDVYVNDGLHTSLPTTTSGSFKVNNLDPGTSYVIGVRVGYTGGYFSYDDVITAQTN